MKLKIVIFLLFLFIINNFATLDSISSTGISESCTSYEGIRGGECNASNSQQCQMIIEENCSKQGGTFDKLSKLKPEQQFSGQCKFKGKMNEVEQANKKHNENVTNFWDYKPVPNFVCDFNSGVLDIPVVFESE